MKSTIPSPSIISWLCIFAIVGQMFLLASSFLLPSVSQFDVLHDRISELALGRFGYIETAAFCVSGIATWGLAVMIRKITSHLPDSFWGSFLIGVYGAGGIIVAFFPTDRINAVTGFASRTTIGTTHIAAAVLGFLCITIGMFILSWAFRKMTRWRAFASWTLICPLLTFVLLFVQLKSPLAGLTERLFILVVAVWIILVANKIRNMALIDNRAREHVELTNAFRIFPLADGRGSSNDNE